MIIYHGSKSKIVSSFTADQNTQERRRTVIKDISVWHLNRVWLGLWLVFRLVTGIILSFFYSPLPLNRGKDNKRLLPHTPPQGKPVDVPYQGIKNTVQFRKEQQFLPRDSASLHCQVSELHAGLVCLESVHRELTVHILKHKRVMDYPQIF